MAKKQKQHKRNEKSQKKGEHKEEQQPPIKEKKVRPVEIQISKMQGDIQSFIDKFKSDIKDKKRSYKEYARRFQKKTSVK